MDYSFALPDIEISGFDSELFMDYGDERFCLRRERALGEMMITDGQLDIGIESADQNAGAFFRFDQIIRDEGDSEVFLD